MTMSKEGNKEEEDAWVFCARCYSIKFKYEDSIGMECCKDCGCTDFRTSTFEEWNTLYKNRYGHPYLEDKGVIRRSPIFMLSIEQLKTRLFRSPHCMEICRVLYPGFPEGLCKEDSVLLLFSKLEKDNRVDALRMEMYNRNKR